MTLERFALITTALALIGTGTLRYSGLTGNLTASEPIGLYIRILEAPTRGDMVELRPLMKHVAAVAGDTVRVTAEGSFINGKLWPLSAPNSSQYKPFAFGVYKLAPGQYWVLGSNPLSYDSRYVGMIPWDLINAPVRPVWTTSNGYAPGTRPW